MKRFEYRVFQENTGYWVGKGEIVAENEDVAHLKLICGDFNCNDWETEDADTITIAQHNGDKLLECLETILTLTKEQKIKDLIIKTIYEMTPIVSVDYLIELDEDN